MALNAPTSAPTARRGGAGRVAGTVAGGSGADAAASAGVGVGGIRAGAGGVGVGRPAHAVPGLVQGVGVGGSGATLPSMLPSSSSRSSSYRRRPQRVLSVSHTLPVRVRRATKEEMAAGDGSRWHVSWKEDSRKAVYFREAGGVLRQGEGVGGKKVRAGVATVRALPGVE